MDFIFLLETLGAELRDRSDATALLSDATLLLDVILSDRSRRDAPRYDERWVALQAAPGHSEAVPREVRDDGVDAGGLIKQREPRDERGDIEDAVGPLDAGAPADPRVAPLQ
jgi:hypothetical protein